MKSRVLILLLVVITALSITMPAYADTPDPDDTPTLVKADVYQALLETGDMLVVLKANIPYATPPSTTVSQTFTWSLMSTDNTTELGNTTGYPYNENGFGYNVYSLYFSAAEVTSLGIVWGTAYPIRLAGNPAVFVTLPVYNYALSAVDYSSAPAIDVKRTLALRILQIATELNIEWGIVGTSTTLIQELEAGTVLSLYGQQVFRGAIYGCQALAPSIFPVSIRDLEITDRTWDTGYTDNLTSQYDATWVGTAKAAGATLFGTSYDLLSIIILLILSAAVLFGNLILTSDGWNGLIDVALLAVIAARLGMYDFGFLLMIAAMCWLYISAKVWFGIVR